MRVPRILCISAVAIGLTPVALADKYDDLAAKGYRWVTVDGAYGFRSRDEVRQIIKGRADRNDVKLIEQLRTYYLISEDYSAGERTQLRVRRRSNSNEYPGRFGPSVNFSACVRLPI